MTAMTISDTERRDVARRLRGLRGGWSSGECYYTIIHALGLSDTSREDGGHALYSRLADLIEPSDSAQTVAGDMFGQMRHSTEQERIAYADMMARNSVELHPVDRDALLELAEDVAESAAMAVAMDDSEGTKLLADMLLDIARRIREALGVES